MKDIIIVDNNIASFSEQMENGIYVPSFYGDPNDAELQKIGEFLKELVGVTDVRPHVQRFAGITALYRRYKMTLKGKERGKNNL